MTVIQPILVLLVASGVVVYFMRFRSRLADRAIVLLLAALATLMVAHPEFTSTLAHTVGVGRGVDLIIYLSLCGFGFIFLVLFSKIRSLEASIAELARAVALATARAPYESGPASSSERQV